MNKISKVIKETLTINQLAQNFFDMNYAEQWEKAKYDSFDSFKRLKEMYKEIPLTRTMIINLFAEGKFYDGFLCAMVWGNIGNNIKGSEIIKFVFDEKNEGFIVNTIKLVMEQLQKGDIHEAYATLNEGDHKISGVGESFFTKLLYFAGATIDNLSPKPLIYDRNMDIVYKATKGKEIKKKPVERYLDYCKMMEEIKESLGLPTSGHVEALLFPPIMRKVLLNV